MNDLIVEITRAAEQAHDEPRYTSLHEAYTQLAQQVHALDSAGKTFVPGHHNLSRAIRADAIRLAALAIKAVIDLDPERKTK
jgi:hypothetical protein